MDVPTPFGDAFLPGWANQHPILHLVFIQWPIGLAPALFTWFLPALLRYQRGQMAWIGAAVSLILTVVLPLQFHAEPIATWYPKVHVWLYGIFYVYALAGLALCGVGIYDRKRSAIWGLLATMSLVLAALHDTLIWFNLLSGRPWVPYGFGACLLLLTVGFIRRRADPPPTADLWKSARILTNNRTRRSRSIFRKLLREGNLHWLPVYALVMQATSGGKESSTLEVTASPIISTAISPPAAVFSAAGLTRSSCPCLRRRPSIGVINAASMSFGRSQPKFRIRHPFAFWLFPAGFHAISPSSVTGSMAL
jgi:hypothetical protein